MGLRMGLSGHAAFEAFSVLTRLPGVNRRPPHDVARLRAVNFPHTPFVTPQQNAALRERLPTIDLSGGMAYDALVGAVAAVHGLPPASRDGRARRVYDALDVAVLFIA